MTSKKGTLPFR